MALSPSSLHCFYHNNIIIVKSKDSTLTKRKRFRNATLYCQKFPRDKLWLKPQFLNFVFCEESDQANTHIRISKTENTFLQTWEAIINAKAWLLYLQSEANYMYNLQTTMATVSLLWILLFNLPAHAADVLKTYECLLKECRVEFAQCIGDPACVANLACIEICNNRPDEMECQLKCGDLFENNVVDQFNQCVVSRKKCVPQKKDEGTFPIPDPSTLVKNFNMEDFNGKWYISSGLNPLFDTYDCQAQEFFSTSTNLTGKLSWRVSTPCGGFFTRSIIQRWVQDSYKPGVLHNHNNEYLHYQEDWYILSSKIKNKPDDYVFVYYRGKNDVWEGFGGSVVYTRSPILPSSIVPELEIATERIGMDFKKFKRTDNSCGPAPPFLVILEKKLEELEHSIAKELEVLEKEAKKFGRTKMALYQIIGEGKK